MLTWNATHHKDILMIRERAFHYIISLMIMYYLCYVVLLMLCYIYVCVHAHKNSHDIKHVVRDNFIYIKGQRVSRTINLRVSYM